MNSSPGFKEVLSNESCGAAVPSKYLSRIKSLLVNRPPPTATPKEQVYRVFWSNVFGILNKEKTFLLSQKLTMLSFCSGSKSPFPLSVQLFFETFVATHPSADNSVLTTA